MKYISIRRHRPTVSFHRYRRSGREVVVKSTVYFCPKFWGGEGPQILDDYFQTWLTFEHVAELGCVPCGGASDKKTVRQNITRSSMHTHYRMLTKWTIYRSKEEQGGPSTAPCSVMLFDTARRAVTTYTSTSRSTDLHCQPAPQPSSQRWRAGLLKSRPHQQQTRSNSVCTLSNGCGHGFVIVLVLWATKQYWDRSQWLIPKFITTFVVWILLITKNVSLSSADVNRRSSFFSRRRGHTLDHTAGGCSVIPFTSGLLPASKDIPLPQIISWCSVQYIPRNANQKCPNSWRTKRSTSATCPHHCDRL